jgi:hypothetical protein
VVVDSAVSVIWGVEGGERVRVEGLVDKRR